MAGYDVTNAAKGARGVGFFLIEPGASMAGVELTDDEAVLLSELDGITLGKAKPAAKAKDAE